MLNAISLHYLTLYLILLRAITLQEKEDAGGKDSENVKVVVRCRPMNEKETSTGCQQVVHVSTFVSSVFVV